MASDTKNTARKRILIVSEHRVGHGSGHLHRCARIAPRLSGDIDWLLPETPEEGGYSRSEALAMIGNPDLPVRWVDEAQGPYDMGILDRREATLHELSAMQVSGVTVGIDLAGEARAYCSYLIDALETPPGAQWPNVADPGLLQLPERTRNDWPVDVKTILVAFGGEESGAGADFARELAAATTASVYLAVRDAISAPEGVIPFEARGDLPEKLADFDLVITHYGLTPYEAIWARVPTLLRNPSRYHSALGRAAGFDEISGVGEVVKKIEDIDSLAKRCERVRPRGTSDIAALINEIKIPGRVNAPSGGDRWQPAIQRFGERTFFENTEDGLVYMQNYRGTTVEYDHDYFFTEYARQYGKTYLEDFPLIRETGRRRVRDILRRSHDRGGVLRLLDIGCAYGPFLQAAADLGCDVTGVDISCDATAYVTRELGFPALCADIRELTPDRLDGMFDIVTMWYVIEHFQELDTVLARVTSLLKPGGMFAFSTPNGAGISATKDLREFYRRSPGDHYSIMTPKTATAVLERHGFVVRRVRVTGHHPERFGTLPSGRHGTYRGLRYRLVQAYSHLARLGDTFELIAEYTG